MLLCSSHFRSYGLLIEQMLGFSTGEVRLWMEGTGLNLTCPSQNFWMNFKLSIDCSRKYGNFVTSLACSLLESTTGPDSLSPPLLTLLGMWSHGVKASYATSPWPMQMQQGRRQSPSIECRSFLSTWEAYLRAGGIAEEKDQRLRQQKHWGSYLNLLPLPTRAFYEHVKSGGDGQAMGWGCWKCSSRLSVPTQYH